MLIRIKPLETTGAEGSEVMKLFKILSLFTVVLSVSCWAVPAKAASLPNPVEMIEKMFSKSQKEKPASTRFQAKLTPASISLSEDPMYLKKKAYYKKYIQVHRFKTARHRVFYQNGF